ncbi:hypothetical protein SARC_14376 [Sphaeroforma arctica JP610]|uniref:Protein kinase domain-containing protein n=1 Tax=Sphaeroforma arctica JP610 TaxID=667725 RepID=A0A0L0F8M6_9EUKA|nr:hypothetical protein SARC_14376 [Sphaeroforma arctica JP610]KNC73064.1 hypothetical protein SARC_14376 [Sphaeroforma arctica JP610]|eukprot:XP_014146966.1 hypothetical protein SARC_14376 [Sphaeroforma arctica JP610]
MLAFNPRDRISVEDALAHPFLESLHDPRDEPVSSKPFDFEWETATPLTLDFIKALVFKEIIDCHPEAYNDIPNPLADKSHPQYEDIRKTLSATGKQLSVFDEVEQAMNPSPVNDRDQLDNSSSTSSLSSGRGA